MTQWEEWFAQDAELAVGTVTLLYERLGTPSHAEYKWALALLARGAPLLAGNKRLIRHVQQACELATMYGILTRKFGGGPI